MFTDGVFTSTWEAVVRRWGAMDAAPRIEPVDPPADVFTAMSAPPGWPPSPWTFDEVDVAREDLVLDRLAALTVERDPWNAALVLFGGRRG